MIYKFKREFPGIVDLKSDTYAKVPAQIVHENIYIGNDIDNDIEILVNKIRDSVLKELLAEGEADSTAGYELPNRSVVVFCENKTKLNRICEELGNANIISLPYNDNTK